MKRAWLVLLREEAYIKRGARGSAVGKGRASGPIFFFRKEPGSTDNSAFFLQYSVSTLRVVGSLNPNVALGSDSFVGHLATTADCATLSFSLAAAPRLSMVPAHSQPVTFAAVRNISGIVSTASRIPIPAAGRFTDVRTGAMTMIPPPGTPGTVRLVATAVTVTVASCHGLSTTPYSFARNKTPTTWTIVPPTRNTEAASGRKKL